jgi:hypothetical protein
MGTCIVSIFQYTSNKMQLYTVYLYLETAYMFRVVLPPIIRSAYNCIYSIWYMSHRYCYLPLSRKSWKPVSNRISTHHQERIQLYLQHLAFLTPLLLSAAIA